MGTSNYILITEITNAGITNEVGDKNMIL